MSFLRLNGWVVRIKRGGAVRGYDLVGEQKRAANGGMLSFSQAQKRTFEFETIPLRRENAIALMGMLSGAGDSWRFEGNYWSQKGVEASTKTATNFGSGRFGQGILIQSGQLVSVPTHSFGVQEGTVALWAHVNSSFLDGTQRKLFRHGIGNLHRVLLHVEADGRYRVMVGNDVNNHDIYVTQSLALNTWHHFAVTYSPKLITFLINGVRVGQVVNPTFYPLAKDSKLEVGHSGGTEVANTHIDDLVVLPYPASDAQVHGFVHGIGNSFPSLPTIWVRGEALGESFANFKSAIKKVEYLSADRMSVSFSLMEV